MMKTHFRNVLACALTVFLFSLLLGGIGLNTALAATDVWDGSTASAFAGGAGTSDNPYQIATGAQLAYLASVVNGSANGEISLDKYYVLTADIDLNHLPWTPIATTYFRGTFDGDGHVISSLSIGSAAVPDTSGKLLGLFGTIAGGTVKNLGIENIAIYASASSRTGGVAGSFSSWGDPMTRTTIFNCYTSGVIVNSREGAAAYAGGLAGTCSGVSEEESLRNLVINCGSTVNVTASGTATTVRAGGLLGLSSLATIKNCYATGDVASGNSIDSSKTGGLIGDNQSANVTNCYWNSDAQQILFGSVSQDPKRGIGNLFTGLTDTTTPKTSSQMKDSAFVTLLNDNRESYAMWGFVSGANNGYPVLLLSAPVISLSPSGNKTFSSQVVGYGAQTPYSVTINNTGSAETGALTIALSGTNASSFALSASSVTTIAAGSSSSFTVAPNTGLLEGTYSATVTVSGDAVTAQTFDVQFTVQAATYSISADPSSLAFGSAIEGYAAPSAQTVTITNDGNSTVTLSLPTVTDYTLTALSASTLASGASATFTVQPKTGLSVGSHNATITVSTNHGTSADVSATFTVQAATYSISADPTSLAFGSAIEGYAAPSAQTVTITNNGNSTVTLSLPTVTDYTLTALSASTLASGASATFTVQPKTGLSVGNHNATITVSTNHSTSADVSTSFTVQAATYSISADPSSLAFGSAVEGYAAPSAQTVTITNDGNSTVTLSLPTVTGYTLTALSASTLASGASATFTVQPKTDLSVGNHNATITVSTNHSTSADVSASFTVQAATYVISANPTRKDFGSITEGDPTPAAVTVTVTNIGNKPVTLNQPTATDYTISALSATDIASAATATFTIAPASGLGVGEYNETINITGSNGTSAQVEVLFTVNETPRYEITADPVSVTFPALAKEYLPPDAQTVTITNTGNQSITLFQPSAANYTLGDLSATTLAPTGTATFTILPKSGLDVGVWDYTLHVQGSYDVDASVDIAFTCTVPHVYAILNGNGSTYQRGDPSSSLVVMTGDGDFEMFTGLTINGELVSAGNYDKASGSTIITLRRDYLDSLGAGTYTMRIHHMDGYTDGRFIIYDAMPVTGDNSTILIFGITTVLCLITFILLKRKRAR